MLHGVSWSRLSNTLSRGRANLGHSKFMTSKATDARRRKSTNASQFQSVSQPVSLPVSQSASQSTGSVQFSDFSPAVQEQRRTCLAWVSTGHNTWARQSNMVQLSGRFWMRDAICLARLYLPADHFSLTKPTVICSVRSRHFSLSYDLHTLHPLPSERLRPYALGKESGIPNPRQGLPAGPEVSRKGPDRVKRRPARVPLNLLLSSFTVAPALPPSYLPFAAIEAWTARRNA